MLKYLNAILLVVLFAACSTAKKDDKGSLSSDSAESTSATSNQDDSDSGKAGDLKTIFFPYDSYELTGETKEILASNIKYLKDNSDVKIQVEGHCDDRGSTQYNLALGENRAQAVKKFLTNAGVADSRVSTTSFGEEKPLDRGANEAAWAKNRRANFVIVAR